MYSALVVAVANVMCKELLFHKENLTLKNAKRADRVL